MAVAMVFANVDRASIVYVQAYALFPMPAEIGTTKEELSPWSWLCINLQVLLMRIRGRSQSRL